MHVDWLEEDSLVVGGPVLGHAGDVEAILPSLGMQTLDPGYALVEDQDEVGMELAKVVDSLQVGVQDVSSMKERPLQQEDSLEEGVDLA